MKTGYNAGMAHMLSLHDHSRCCGQASLTPEQRIFEAEAVCLKRGTRLTEQRRSVLEVLIAADRALGAYDLIDRIAAKSNKRIAPITIYRALEFLVDNGLVHRIESQNAYLACHGGHGAHPQAVFMICEACGKVAEALSDDLETAISQLASSSGFRPKGRVIELIGCCETCTVSAGA